MSKSATDPNLSVWISASAGTGKTKILVDRVLRLLLAGKKNILCLTFTNAAANEMESRINAILGIWSTCSSDELVNSLLVLLNTKPLNFHLLRARRLFSQLSTLPLTIQTIHAFCYKLVSNFPIEAGIELGYILEDCSKLHTKIMDDLLIDKSIEEYISSIAAEIDEEKLKDLFLSLLQNKAYNYDIEKVLLKLGPQREYDDIPQSILKNIKKLADILNKGSKRDKKYGATLTDWYNLSSDNRLDRLDDLAKILIDPKLLVKKNLSSIITKSTLEAFPKAREIILKEQDVILKIFKEFNSYQIATRTINLLRIFNKFTALYSLEKKKNSILDYDDVVTLALHLITDHKSKDWILFNLYSKIDHILVDEAQDNSSYQWQIIINLCSEFFSGVSTVDEKRTIFVVGDVKQSIYRFQGANPILFNTMHEYLKEQSCKEDWLSLKLNQSFRSTWPILLLVDTLFNNFRKEISFLEDQIEHIPFRKKDQGYLEIWPLLPKANNEKDIALQTNLHDIQNPNRMLAATVVYKINKWLKDGRILPAKNRHIEAKDIMILVRKRNILIDYLTGEFKRFNIPVQGCDYFKIMDYIAVQDLVALAEFLLLPENDTALACVLKSPLLNFTEEDLLNICYNRKDKSLWTQLKTHNQKVSIYLESLIEISRSYSPLFFYNYILTLENKKKFAARLGIGCLEVINEFISLLTRFEYKGLQFFTEWIKENNPEIKNDVNSRNEAVQITTIHNAKGLQAPIVFLVDTTSVPKSNDTIILDEEGIPFWCSANSNLYCNQIKEKKSYEDYNEYLRLLYVAMTRAEDELYILGKEPVQNNSWFNLIKIQKGIYEKNFISLYPMFKEEVEVLCINRQYPQIYKKRNSLDIETTQVPEKLKQKQDFKHIETEYNNKESIDRGKIIHKVLQYLPNIPNKRREHWIKSYLSSMNLSTNTQNEVTKKIIEFNKKFGDIFTIECKTEVALNGVIDKEVVSVRLDVLCLREDKITIIDYKSHHSSFLSKEIKQQMFLYKTLVQSIFPNKKIECIVIWLEDLSALTLNN